MARRSDIVALARHDLLGFHTHPGTAEDYLALIERHVVEREPVVVLYHNLHTLYGYFTSDALHRAFEDTTIILDGMGVLFLYRLAGVPMNRDYRLTYVDFIMPMMTMAREGDWKVFHIGQRDEVRERAFALIRRHAPGIRLDGRDGYFDRTPGSAEQEALLRRIEDFAPDILIVGLGTPAQELWIDAHRARLAASVTVIMSAGSCMEYIAGEVGTAPRWMGRAGLEWLYRLFQNPRRFAFRYLIQPFLLGAHLFRHRSGR